MLQYSALYFVITFCLHNALEELNNHGVMGLDKPMWRFEFLTVVLVKFCPSGL
jgi:hypothetical protein